MGRLHNQFPTLALRQVEYEKLLPILALQLAVRSVADGLPSKVARKAAVDALVNTCQTSNDQTILGWLHEAGARLGVNADDCEGV